MGDWLAHNSGTALTVGGSIVVALIGLVGVVWVKFYNPKTPTPIQDVWTENRSLRADLRTAEAERDAAEDEHRKAMSGVNVLWRYVHRLKLAWGVRPDMPDLTASERRTLAPLVEDLDTPGAGTPVADTTN